MSRATFLAAIGDIRRFEGQRQLVGYLGLDPRVRQSGTSAAVHGHISKRGSAPARHALVEASWSVVRQLAASGGQAQDRVDRLQRQQGVGDGRFRGGLAGLRRISVWYWCRPVGRGAVGRLAGRGWSPSAEERSIAQRSGALTFVAPWCNS